MNVHKRIDKLEQQVAEAGRQTVVFRQPVDEAGNPIPVLAWSRIDTGEVISRLNGESDEDLSTRAENAANGESVRYWPVI